MEAITQQIPEWFTGEIYTEGGTVKNPFSGEEIELNALELSIYDFVNGCSLINDNTGGELPDWLIIDWRKGLQWFRYYSPKAYMVLLD